jgi:hypothetical protein
MLRATVRLAVPAGLLALVPMMGACATSGSLDGWLSAQGVQPERVQFSYTTDAFGPGGTLVARLPNGEAFTGRYRQGWSTIEAAQPQVPGLGSVFFDWGGAGAPGFMEDDPIPVYQTAWSSKVSATLAGDRGRSMSCRLRLRSPQAGLGGGGDGRCLLSDGGRIDLQF